MGGSTAWSRRAVLRTAASAALGASVAGAVGAGLSGCTRPDLSAAPPPAPAPDAPVRWPVTDDNPPVTDGASPEAGPLLLYTYADYIAPDVLSAFEERYGVQVQVTTFSDQDEAATKIRDGDIPFDVYVPSYDSLGRLVAAGLLRPLNHSYLDHIANVWPFFTDPWYDRGWQYTVPLTVFSTGIGWRADRLGPVLDAYPTPYDVLWDRALAGEVAVIDDWHTAMSMVALREGLTDVNPTSAGALATIRDGLASLARRSRPRVTSAMYTQLPAGQLTACQMWSGDAVNAQYYLPEDGSTDDLGYWFPQDGPGMVDNDLLVVLRGGRNPVLAHHFLQHMLDADQSLANFSYSGYQPPQTSLDPETLVADGYLAPNLAAAAVTQEAFEAGYRLLQLPARATQDWGTTWLWFTAGGR